MNYFVYLDGEAKGPYTIGQLQSMWQAGLVTAKTPYCEPGYDEWLDLEILSAELEPPKRAQPLPMKNASIQSKISKAQGRGKGILLIGVSVVFGFVLLGWLVNGNSRKLGEAEPMAISGIETLPPITVRLNNELLNALRMTDELDTLYKRGCSSREFASVGGPAESAALKLQSRLPKDDPRHDLLVNTFEGYQSVALAMARKEQGLRTESPNVLLSVAQLRKHLLSKILEGDMTQEEKTVYYAWQ